MPGALNLAISRRLARAKPVIGALDHPLLAESREAEKDHIAAENLERSREHSFRGHLLVIFGTGSAIVIFFTTYFSCNYLSSIVSRRS